MGAERGKNKNGIGSLLVIFLALNLLRMNYCDNEQNNSTKNQTNKKDMIFIYKKGKEIKVLPDSPYFNDLKNEIEELTININNAYELIPSEEKINNMKRRSIAIELIYSSPKELPIKFLKKPLAVVKIIVPLKDDYFPKDCILVYDQEHQDFPHTFANTAQSKEKLLKLIKTTESKP